MPTASAGFVATGIQGLADVMEMQFSTHYSDGRTSDDRSVEVDFVGVTSSDIHLQDQEEPPSKYETETEGDQIDNANNVFPEEGFVLAAVEQPTSRFSTKSPDVPLVRIVSAFVLLSSAGVLFCSYPTICKARPVDLPMQSIYPQEGRAGCTRYNGDHTPNAVDCRATPSSVSTLAIMAARGYCFLECFSWRRKRAVIDTIRRRCIGYRDVLRRLSSGPPRRFKFGDVVS
jgi:hypothetical protein